MPNQKNRLFLFLLLYLAVEFILAITMGLINELRAYYNALPIIYILAMLGVFQFVRDIKQKRIALILSRPG